MSSVLASAMMDDAVICARVISAAYLGRQSVRELACGFNKSQYRFVEDANWQAAVIAANSKCYVGIVGSNDLRDWAINLSARLDKETPMHAGFLQGAHEIILELRRNGLRDMLEGRDLILSGHSAGGIMAQTMLSIAADLPCSAVFTFGAPRGFSPEMAGWVNACPAKCLRFTMSGDPVPHFPLRRFRKLFAGATYAHAGIEVRLHDDGTVEVERGCGLSDKIKLAFQLFGAYSLRATPFRIVSVLARNHSIDRYLSALKCSQLPRIKK